MYSAAILFKYLMEFTNYIYSGIVNTFSWCGDLKEECPAPFPPFCPQLNKKEEKIELENLKEIFIEEQPKEEPKRKKSETDWDIISSNN